MNIQKTDETARACISGFNFDLGSNHMTWLVSTVEDRYCRAAKICNGFKLHSFQKQRTRRLMESLGKSSSHKPRVRTVKADQNPLESWQYTSRK